MNEEASNGEEEAATIQLSFVESYSLGGIPSPAATEVAVQPPTLTCHAFVEDKVRRVLIGGLSDGDVLIWKPKRESSKGKTADMTTVALKGHRGAVHCLSYIPELGPDGLLLTGSADRTIRVWYPWNRNTASACVQTLIGHGGTVTAVAYARGCIFSCSTDGTFRVWNSDRQRQLMLYPSFVLFQTISDFDGAWTTDLSVRDSEAMTVYVGDARGVLSVYVTTRQQQKQQALTFGGAGTANDEINLGADPLVLGRPQQHIHSLGISRVLLVPQLNFCITLSHDQTVKIHDATNGAAFYSLSNTNRCRFTHVGWGLARQELYLVDEVGCMQMWNVYANKCLHMARVRDGPLNGISVLGHDRLLLTSIDEGEIWQISRLAQVRDFRGHEAPILRLLWLDAQRLVSASLDNTVRGWNPHDMSGGVLLREKQSEISCMIRGPAADASSLFTGHQDGSVRLWNSDTGGCVTLQHHTDSVTGMCVYRVRRKDYLISVACDGRCAVWDITRRRHTTPTGVELSVQIEPLATSGLGAVEQLTSVCVNELDDTILVGVQDGSIRVLDFSTGDEAFVLSAHTDVITCMVRDANILLTSSDDKTICVWDLFSHQLLQRLEGHGTAVRDLCLIGNRGILLSVAFESEIFVWDYITGTILQKIEHDDQFRCVLYQPPFSINQMVAMAGNSADSMDTARTDASTVGGESKVPQHKVLVGTERNTITSFLLDHNLFEQSDQFEPRELRMLAEANDGYISEEEPTVVESEPTPVALDEAGNPVEPVIKRISSSERRMIATNERTARVRASYEFWSNVVGVELASALYASLNMPADVASALHRARYRSSTSKSRNTGSSVTPEQIVRSHYAVPLIRPRVPIVVHATATLQRRSSTLDLADSAEDFITVVNQTSALRQLGSTRTSARVSASPRAAPSPDQSLPNAALMRMTGNIALDLDAQALLNRSARGTGPVATLQSLMQLSRFPQTAPNVSNLGNTGMLSATVQLKTAAVPSTPLSIATPTPGASSARGPARAPAPLIARPVTAALPSPLSKPGSNIPTRPAPVQTSETPRSPVVMKGAFSPTSASRAVHQRTSSLAPSTERDRVLSNVSYR